jgi:hypothetical protein
MISPKGVDTKLNGDAMLSQVSLEIPSFQVGTFPKVLPDPRFKPTLAAFSPGSLARRSSFKYSIFVRTLPGNPVQILSNLAQGPIPVEVALKLVSEQPITGKVHISRFPIEIFRRKAIIDHFSIDLRAPMSTSPVDGKISVDYADYQVIVSVSHTIDRPQIHLSSEPPLPENQLVSVLLFGHTMDQLDAEQGSSVAHTRAAFSNGAVSLASFYLLASTPVQSISYDPSTGAVIAKVKLGEGTSLNLGTNVQESPTLGFRKRLGSAWSIQTDVVNTPDIGPVASAYLEWSHRY